MINRKPRVLVIAYDFPPHGAIGTMRTLRLVRELHQTGWEVTVLTGSPQTYLPDTPVEPGLQSWVPEGVKVLAVRAVRPFTTLERLMRGRGRPAPAAETGAKARPVSPVNGSGSSIGWRRRLTAARDSIESVLDIPDKESGWMVPAIIAGLDQFRRHGRPDVIYSSAPPWSGQVVALMLARASRRPWLADFRDPWARAPWRSWRSLRRRAIVSLERQVVGRADGLLFVTEANRSEYSRHYGARTAQKFHLVPNGCDPTELEAIQASPSTDTCVLLHAGTLYGARSPLPVIRAIAGAVSRGALDRSRFRLRLLGTVSLAFDLPRACRSLGIEEVVEFVPRVTRRESLRAMKSASALLLIQTGTTVSVPGKAYEYLASGRPILALADEGETASLVRASGAGVSVRPDDPLETIEAALLEVVSRASQPFTPVAPHWFDGRLHAATTARMLREVLDGNRFMQAVADAPGSTHSRVAGIEGEPR